MSYSHLLLIIYVISLKKERYSHGCTLGVQSSGFCRWQNYFIQQVTLYAPVLTDGPSKNPWNLKWNQSVKEDLYVIIREVKYEHLCPNLLNLLNFLFSITYSHLPDFGSKLTPERPDKRVSGEGKTSTIFKILVLETQIDVERIFCRSVNRNLFN